MNDWWRQTHGDTIFLDGVEEELRFEMWQDDSRNASAKTIKQNQNRPKRKYMHMIIDSRQTSYFINYDIPTERKGKKNSYSFVVRIKHAM